MHCDSERILFFFDIVQYFPLDVAIRLQNSLSWDTTVRLSFYIHMLLVIKSFSTLSTYSYGSLLGFLFFVSIIMWVMFNEYSIHSQLEFLCTFQPLGFCVIAAFEFFNTLLKACLYVLNYYWTCRFYLVSPLSSLVNI